jgi:hypothetical protein
MYNVWLMDLRAQPPAIVAHISSSNRDVTVALAQAAARTYPGPEFTLVHEVGSEPIEIREEANARGIAHL